MPLPPMLEAGERIVLVPVTAPTPRAASVLAPVTFSVPPTVVLPLAASVVKLPASLSAWKVSTHTSVPS